MRIAPRSQVYSNPGGAPDRNQLVDGIEKQAGAVLYCPAIVVRAPVGAVLEKLVNAMTQAAQQLSVA